MGSANPIERRRWRVQALVYLDLAQVHGQAGDAWSDFGWEHPKRWGVTRPRRWGGIGLYLLVFVYVGICW